MRAQIHILYVPVFPHWVGKWVDLIMFQLCTCECEGEKKKIIKINKCENSFLRLSFRFMMTDMLVKHFPTCH